MYKLVKPFLFSIFLANIYACDGKPDEYRLILTRSGESLLALYDDGVEKHRFSDANSNGEWDDQDTAQFYVVLIDSVETDHGTYLPGTSIEIMLMGHGGVFDKLGFHPIPVLAIKDFESVSAKQITAFRKYFGMNLTETGNRETARLPSKP